MTGTLNIFIEALTTFFPTILAYLASFWILCLIFLMQDHERQNAALSYGRTRKH